MLLLPAIRCNFCEMGEMVENPIFKKTSQQGLTYLWGLIQQRQVCVFMCLCECVQVTLWVVIIFVCGNTTCLRLHECVRASMCACMCAQKHALAARSKHSHVKAIIISPPAIITTSDSPLPAKLISPSFQVFGPPASNLSLLPSPPWPTHFSGICPHLLSSSLFLLFLCVWQFKEKPVFHSIFFRFYLLRGCYALLRCVCTQSLTEAAGHAPHPWRRTV